MKIKITVFFALFIIAAAFSYSYSGWDSGTEIDTGDPGEDIGRFCTLKYSNGVLHATWLDKSSSILLYSKKDLSENFNNWVIAGTQGGVHGYVSMDIDNFGQPAIVYSDYDKFYHTKYTAGSFPVPEEIFDPATATDCKDTSIAVDGNGFSHILMYVNVGAMGLFYINNLGGTFTPSSELNVGAQLVNSGWGNSITYANNYLYATFNDLDGSSNEIAYGMYMQVGGAGFVPLDETFGKLDDRPGEPKGRITSVEYFGNSPHCIYTSNGKIYYASHAGDRWNVEEIPGTQCNRYLDLALDQNGMPHIAYYDDLSQTVNYTFKNSSSQTPWQIETVNNSVGIYDHAGDGYSPSLAIDAADNIHLLYYNASNMSMWYSVRTPEGSDEDDDTADDNLPIEHEFKEHGETIVGNTVFNPNDAGRAGKCRIMYRLDSDQPVTIKIYDLSGRLLKTLLEKVESVQGNNSVSWNGLNENELPVPSGLYYVVVEGTNFKTVKKVAVNKGRGDNN